jgi:hypothetical protein
LKFFNFQQSRAGHFAFLPLCDNNYIKKTAPEIYNDPDIQREELQKFSNKFYPSLTMCFESNHQFLEG